LKKLVKFQIKEIFIVAFEGFLSNRYYFREHHLSSTKINFENTTTFLINNIKFVLMKGKAVTYFAHLMWQEFFVAIKLRLFTSKQELENILPKLKSDKFEMVTRFLFGLCNKHTMDELLDCVQSSCNVESKELNSETDCEECEEMLKGFAIEILRRHRDAKRRPIGDDHEKEGDPYVNSILPILVWVREMGNDEFTKQAAACLKDEVVIHENEILPSDVTNTNYVLRARQTGLVLFVEDPHFIGNSDKYFFKELGATLNENSNIQVNYRAFSVYGKF